MSNPNENPVGFVEIPVTNLERAIHFYNAVFGYDFKVEDIDGNRMAFSPFDEVKPGACFALTQGEIYVPTHHGAVVYLNTLDIDSTLARATAQGSKQLYPKTAIGPRGFVAEFEDSEGNRIALYQPPAAE